MVQPLKISLDYHGVIDKDIGYWREFCYIAKKHHHKIYIISGGPLVLIRQKLSQHNIEYDTLWCVLDYCLAISAVKMNNKGHFSIDDNLWNIVKGQFCRRGHINLHIDDSAIYQKYFTTPYCLYDKASCSCIVANKKINLSYPQQFLEQIEQITPY